MEDKKKEKLYLKYNKYFPTKYVDNILDITSEELIENGIKGVILDLDNTIIDKKGIEVPDFEKWKDKILKNGIKIVIVTNNFLKKRIEKVTNKYNLEYILFARKPNIKALVKAKEMMEIKESENIAVIGDQVFTDVLRRKTILVKPLSEKKDYMVTKLLRGNEKKVLKEYKKYIDEKGEIWKEKL